MFTMTHVHISGKWVQV